MKPLMLSAAVALSLGALAVPASAQSVVIGGGDRDCRMVEKRVIKENRTVITKQRVCDDDRRSYRDDRSRDRYVERRDDRRERYVERRDDGPGIYIGR